MLDEYKKNTQERLHNQKNFQMQTIKPKEKIDKMLLIICFLSCMSIRI